MLPIIVMCAAAVDALLACFHLQHAILYASTRLRTNKGLHAMPQGVRERMGAGRRLAEAIRRALPSCRGSPTPELGVSRSGRGRKVRKVREATPTAESAVPEAPEATIDSLLELQLQAQALHLDFPERQALQDAVDCHEHLQVGQETQHPCIPQAGMHCCCSYSTVCLPSSSS